MVRVCYICNIDSHAPGAEYLTFHSLPVGMEKRNLWISRLGFDQKHQFPRKADICSKHFDQDDYIYREDGSKYLKSDATPVTIHFAFVSLETESIGSDSTATAVSSGDYYITEPELDDGHVEKRIKMETSISGSLREKTSEIMITAVKPGCSTMEDYSSSSTLSASEIEDRTIEKHTDLTPKRRKKTIRYAGDLSTDDFSSPAKAKKNYRLMKTTMDMQRKKIRSLQATVLSLKKRVKTLNGLLKYMRDKNFISEDAEQIVKATIPEYASKLFDPMLKGPSTQKCSPTLRSFAFYSPRAYNFVRNSFNKSLPQLSTINKWYSSIDGSPGFTQEALTALRIKRQEAESQNKIYIVF